MAPSSYVRKEVHDELVAQLERAELELDTMKKVLGDMHEERGVPRPMPLWLMLFDQDEPDEPDERAIVLRAADLWGALGEMKKALRVVAQETFAQYDTGWMTYAVTLIKLEDQFSAGALAESALPQDTRRITHQVENDPEYGDTEDRDEYVDGRDECVECGAMFNATAADTTPVCPRCRLGIPPDRDHRTGRRR